jgi:hypothetical protein
MYIFQNIRRSVILAVFFSFLFIGHSQNQANKYEEFAQFIAGKAFPTSLDSTTTKVFWDNYKQKLDNDWTEIDTSRLQIMLNWQKEEIAPKMNKNNNVFYPFSGPDFLHVYSLFPTANNYLMLAQEHLGKIPDIATMKPQELKNYMDKFYYSIRDIFQRSYFITMRMTADLYNDKIQGVLPLVLFFLAQTNHTIIDVQYEKLQTNNTFIPLTTTPTGRFASGECFLIQFTDNHGDTIVKTLRYFRCDLSDAGLQSAQNFKNFINNYTENCITYTKSASYLMHNETFSTIRKIVLNNSYIVFQDDTGVPYKHFDAKIWTKYLYGTYMRPIADFGAYLTQNDLKKAYEDKEDVYPLPFSLGYHWRDGQQNQMMFIKK